jgi:hypothetical protein
MLAKRGGPEPLQRERERTRPYASGGVRYGDPGPLGLGLCRMLQAEVRERLFF